jgi:hypothetical protein
VEKKYLRAGEFGAAARLSPKALRLYAESGLLVPASVDPEAVESAVAPELTDAVALREVPATKVVCRSRRIDSAGLPGLVRTAEQDIRAHVRACGLPGDGPKLVSFQELVTPDSEGLVEVAVSYDGTVEPVDDLYIRLVPAHTEAYLPVPAPFEDFPLILRVYDAVEAWTDAHPGVTCSGHPYEIYPGTGARFDVAYPVTD